MLISISVEPDFSLLKLLVSAFNSSPGEKRFCFAKDWESSFVVGSLIILLYFIQAKNAKNFLHESTFFPMLKWLEKNLVS